MEKFTFSRSMPLVVAEAIMNGRFAGMLDYEQDSLLESAIYKVNHFIRFKVIVTKDSERLNLIICAINNVKIEGDYIYISIIEYEN
jgi:hypothetical protein